MQRTRKRRGGGKKRQKSRPSSPSRGIRAFRPLQPTNLRRTVSFTTLALVNQAGALGANTTIPLYLLTSAGFVGLTSFWQTGAAQNNTYTSARLLGVRAKVSFQNNEAFAARAAVYLGSADPANNSLSGAVSQNPFISRTNGVSSFSLLGPLTGKGQANMVIMATNSQTLGISHVRGISDPYTNSWDSATNAAVGATSGLSLVVFILSQAVNLVSGVLAQIECDCDCEFFGLNSYKTT